MNGYEGDLAAHLRQNPDALFQTRSSSSQLLSTPNPLLAYGNNERQSYPPILPPPRTVYTSSSCSSAPESSIKLAEHAAILTQQGNKPETPVWEERNTSQLHPAIRQDYTAMFHHQYQPTPQSSEPALGGSLSSTETQKTNWSMLPTNSYQSQRQGQSLAALPTQHYQPPQMQPQTPFAQAYPTSEPYSHGTVKPQPLYAHQQYFQKPPPLLRDVPDVPADSTSLVEQMMANLRKATARDQV